MQGEPSTRARLKRIIIESLNLEGTTPETIEDEAPLFGEDGGLGLDSVDALELVVALEKEYGVSIESEAIEREAFASVASMAAFIDRLRLGEEAKAAG